MDLSHNKIDSLGSKPIKTRFLTWGTREASWVTADLLIKIYNEDAL
jgi:hypothetical protein